MKFENTFGETVKKLRESKGLTLREVAIALEVDTSMLGKVEKNNRKPTKFFIEKCSKYFDVDEGELTIAFLSDEIAYQIYEQPNVSQVFKVAERKVKYLKSKPKFPK